MAEYKSKTCNICKEDYKPTSPKQKFCYSCKNSAEKIAQSERDKKRNRLKHSNVYEKVCPICNTQFKTFNSRKIYCGNEECEIKRKRINGLKIDKKRNIERSVTRRYKRALRISKIIKYIKSYVTSFNYTLMSAIKYKTSHNSMLVLKCPEGHLWETTFHAFKDNAVRCAICYQQNNYISKPEQLIRDFIKDNFPDIVIKYNDRTVIRPKELDMYLPEFNLAIEICGLYWHGELHSGKARNYHYNKMMDCFNKGIRLITIFEDELYNHKDIVLSRLRQAIGAPVRRIFARKCSVAEISSSIANNFYSCNHIQGPSTALVRYGIYYKDELVGVGSLGNVTRKHTSDKATLEFKRFCTLQNTSIIGGISKIFKVMVNYALTHEFKEIKSYCDMRYANIFNPVYEVLGFTLASYTKYTPHYFKGQKRYRNMSLRKTVTEKQTGLTEWELRKSQGYDRIWDCGHRTYIYTIN